MKKTTEDDKKYPAPALARGLVILEQIVEKGPVSLENLALNTNYPKASVARILQTLTMMGYIRRDPENLKYSPLISITPTNEGMTISTRIILSALKYLAEQTGFTSEWYIYANEAMILKHRYETEHAMIVVRARIGFRRELNGEFEAVLRTALAFGILMPENHKYWTYENGKKIFLSEDEVVKRLNLTRNNFVTMDKGYNPYGVRRYAAPVFHKNGFLAGIIAIAETYTPDGDLYIDKNLRILKKCVEKFFST